MSSEHPMEVPSQPLQTTTEARADPQLLAVGPANGRRCLRRIKRKQGVRRLHRLTIAKRKTRVPDDIEELCDRPRNVQGVETAPNVCSGSRRMSHTGNDERWRSFLPSLHISSHISFARGKDFRGGRSVPCATTE